MHDPAESKCFSFLSEIRTFLFCVSACPHFNIYREAKTATLCAERETSQSREWTSARAYGGKESTASLICYHRIESGMRRRHVCRRVEGVFARFAILSWPFLAQVKRSTARDAVYHLGGSTSYLWRAHCESNSRLFFPENEKCLQFFGAVVFPVTCGRSTSIS